MITKITFENYKAFSSKQELEIKPITILVGKNSSGKSAISKLFALFENSLSNNLNEPLLLSNNNVELGNEFRDLVYAKNPPFEIEFSLSFNSGITILVRIIKPDYSTSNILRISKWQYSDGINNVELNYNPQKGNYINEKQVEYNCNFSGFIPTLIINTETDEDLCKILNLDNLSINVDYIGPFRIIPPSTFVLTGEQTFEKVGIRGENSYKILGNSKLNKTDLITEVGNWYKEHFDGWVLDIEDKREPYLEVILKKTEKYNVNISHVGQGMSQALPLVVRSFMKTVPSYIVLEQPELHLHPAAHADLAELFANSALDKGHKYIIETHSENILLRLRKLIVDENSKLSSDDVVIYWVDVDDDEHYLDKITINEYGELSNWPTGVFNENVDEILEIKKAVQLKKEKQNDCKD